MWKGIILIILGFFAIIAPFIPLDEEELFSARTLALILYYTAIAIVMAFGIDLIINN